jgi:NAD-dependent dihydropyrimidine dehydrogenase PreA subunit
MSLKINPEKCEGCGLCVPACPAQAISISGDQAVIDQTRCDECLLCLDECPTKAIYQSSDKTALETVSPARQTLASQSSQRGAGEVAQMGGMLLVGIKKIIDGFLNVRSSLGRGGKNFAGKYHRQRKRHRGGRF